MGKKLTYEFIKAEFEKEGYVLLSEEYINSRTKLKYQCQYGHVKEGLWLSWVRHKYCEYCYNEYMYLLIKGLLAQDNYTLLSKEYVGSDTKLQYICPEGHVHSTTWDGIKQGQRCGKCKGNVEVTYAQVKASFEKEDYILLSKEYINARLKLEYICPKGHRHKTSWHKFSSGRRCAACKAVNISESKQGDKSHFWKGGISSEPYCPIWSDKGYKADIKTRDDNTCQNPYCFCNDEMLSIHHIDYNKKNCHPSNLITICRACNSRANIDRDWHMDWYQTLMSKKFEYRY